MILAGEAQQTPPVTLLDVGGVNDNQLAERKALGGYVVEEFERVWRDGLVVFVVRDKPATLVRCQDFRRLEMLARKR